MGAKSELLSLENIGPAALEDFHQLGIFTIIELAKADADELYLRIQVITGKKRDPCVWDVFAETIHEAKTGEKTKWWEWTTIRKAKHDKTL